MYCSLVELEDILAQALTTASPNPTLSALPGKLTSLGRTLNLGLIETDSANNYIRIASSQIDAALSQQYVVPLKQLAYPEMTLLADTDEYTDEVTLSKAAILVPGDTLYFSDGTYAESAEVESVDGDAVNFVDALSNIYLSSNTRVLRLKFPDPIPVTCARLAAAAIYDKYAKSQNEPGKSDFGDALRKEGFSELNNIREGRTILHGIPRIGWRFANAELLDRYPLKGSFEQDSTRSSDQGKS